MKPGICLYWTRNSRKGLEFPLLMLWLVAMYTMQSMLVKNSVSMLLARRHMSKSKPLKLGGGFYVSKVEPNIPGKPKEIYVFNGFFASAISVCKPEHPFTTTSWTETERFIMG